MELRVISVVLFAGHLLKVRRGRGTESGGGPDGADFKFTDCGRGFGCRCSGFHFIPVAAQREAQGGCDRRGDEARVGQRRQLDEPGPIGKIGGTVARDIECQRGLSDPAGPGQGDDAVCRQQVAQPLDDIAAPDKADRGGRDEDLDDREPAVAQADGLEHGEAAGNGGAERLGLRDGAHHEGGTRMGSDPKDSVVNKYSQSWDIPNLFIVGSSTFPTMGTGFNPTLTIQALAYLTADAIVNKYRKNPGQLI